jgi:hypothetical protein
VRPLLCGDLSRVAAGGEWSLPVPPPHPIEREQLQELLGEAGASALARASSAGELSASLRRVQRRWARSHPRAAVRSVGDAVTGRLRRRFLDPAACVFVATPRPEVVLEAAQELAVAARRMFVDVRPAAMPSSRLRRMTAELGAWRAPPVSEFVVTVVVGRPSEAVAGGLQLLHRVLPTTVLRLSGGLSREQARTALRARIVDFLAETYSPSAFPSSREQGQRVPAPAARRVEQPRV